MTAEMLLCSYEECEQDNAAQLLCDCGPQENVLGARVFHDETLAEPEQCVWHINARQCTGSTVLCKDCQLLVRGICPECPKGCMCEVTCTGWRHAQWRGYEDDDSEDAQEDRYEDDRYYDHG